MSRSISIVDEEEGNWYMIDKLMSLGLTRSDAEKETKKMAHMEVITQEYIQSVVGMYQNRGSKTQPPPGAKNASS